MKKLIKELKLKWDSLWVLIEDEVNSLKCELRVLESYLDDHDWVMESKSYWVGKKGVRADNIRVKLGMERKWLV